jgi:dethiobiotin synthetase
MSQGQAFFITGTDTGVGKTVVTACLTALLSLCGYDTVPYKPVQSGGIPLDGQLIAEDVEFYRMLHPLPHPQQELCTYCLEPAVSPHLAARLTNTFIDPLRIEQQVNTLRQRHDIVLVEGAGGLAVPLRHDEQGIYMTSDLIKQLQLSLLIVTHPGLGTLNHTVLTAKYAPALNIPVLGIIVNNMPACPADMERDNVQMMTELTGLPVLGTLPQLTDFSGDTLRTQLSELRQHINLALLLDRLEQAKASLL